MLVLAKTLNNAGVKVMWSVRPLDSGGIQLNADFCSNEHQPATSWSQKDDGPWSEFERKVQARTDLIKKEFEITRTHVIFETVSGRVSRVQVTDAAGQYAAWSPELKVWQ